MTGNKKPSPQQKWHDNRVAVWVRRETYDNAQAMLYRLAEPGVRPSMTALVQHLLGQWMATQAKRRRTKPGTRPGDGYYAPLPAPRRR